MKPKDYKPLISVPDSHEYTQVRQKSILPLKENNITISPYVTGQISTSVICSAMIKRVQYECLSNSLVSCYQITCMVLI